MISTHNFSLVNCKYVKTFLLLYLNVIYIFIVYYYDFLKIPQYIHLRWRKEFFFFRKDKDFENTKDFNTFLNKKILEFLVEYLRIIQWHKLKNENILSFHIPKTFEDVSLFLCISIFFNKTEIILHLLRFDKHFI